MYFNGFSFTDTYRNSLADCFGLVFIELVKMFVEVFPSHLFLQLIEGACQLILHTDIHSIRCTTVVLQ